MTTFKMFFLSHMFGSHLLDIFPASLKQIHRVTLFYFKPGPYNDIPVCAKNSH